MDELIKKSGITTKSDVSLFKYGQEAQIVPSAYLPSLYRDNISIFSTLLSFKKKELREAVKLALIHKLIHDYHAQEILGLERSIDRNKKYLYTTEGPATFINNQIAQDIPLSKKL